MEQITRIDQNIVIRNIIPERERLQALFSVVKGRESAMVNMLLGAYLKRWANVPCQLRHEVISKNTYVIFLEPADDAQPLLPSSAPDESSLMPIDRIDEYAQKFAGQCYASKDPRNCAIRVMVLDATLVAINFELHKSQFPPDHRPASQPKLEPGATMKSAEPTPPKLCDSLKANKLPSTTN